MSAMTYSDEFCESSAGQKLSPEPLASDVLPKSGHCAVAPFLRPGPEVLSESIPVFFIGRNRDGLWVARDTEGKCGGLFWRKESALRFAKRSAWPAGCATVFREARFELDIENAGNPLAGYIGTARRLLTHRVHRLSAAIRKAARL